MATTAPELETKSLPANAYQPLKEGELYVPLVPTGMNLPGAPPLSPSFGDRVGTIFTEA